MKLVTRLFITLVYFGGLYPSASRSAELYPHNPSWQIAYTMLWPFPITTLAVNMLIDENHARRLP